MWEQSKLLFFNFKTYFMLDKIKTIIRIEYPLDGLGIFTTYLGANFNHDKREIRPIDEFCREAYIRHMEFNDPFQDKLNLKKDNKNWFCSYKSIEQLQQWIKPEELKTIIEEGYKVFMLDVFEYQEGKDQIIYTKDSIQSSKNITSLFK